MNNIFDVSLAKKMHTHWCMYSGHILFFLFREEFREENFLGGKNQTGKRVPKVVALKERASPGFGQRICNCL